MIIADLIGLAQSKAITGAVLLSGDADLTPGVTTAQGLGIRVHLLSMGPASATSPFLRAEVDLKAYWGDATVQKFATPNATPIAVAALAAAVVSGEAASVASATDVYKDVAISTLRELGHPGTPVALEGGSIPRAADGKLLWLAKQRFSRDLTEPEKRALRSAFKALLATG